MHRLARTLIASALIVATGVAAAGPRYYDDRRPEPRHHHGGSGLGALVLGLAVAVPLIALAHEASRPPEPVYVPPPAPLPPPVVYAPAPPVAYVAPRRAPVVSAAVPVIYPRNGQSPAQQEADYQDCNRWATTQQAAMADTSVFNRAVDACMDGRGYTLR
ncbi:hypothetical protein [Roseateles sp. BYS87W]|uniref:Uncharacterized protein n=1 Tax=Pelomonas baiyunensis TaxID=3299026 RepID=A0ABW7GUV6_9BURK